MDEQKLNEMYEMTRENNSMLRSMRRNAMIGGAIKFIFWVIVLVVIPYYVWQYFQPYLGAVTSFYDNAQNVGSGQSSGSPSFSDLQKFFSQFGGGSAK